MYHLGTTERLPTSHIVFDLFEFDLYTGQNDIPAPIVPVSFCDHQQRTMKPVAVLQPVRSARRVSAGARPLVLIMRFQFPRPTRRQASALSRPRLAAVTAVRCVQGACEAQPTCKAIYIYRLNHCD